MRSARGDRLGWRRWWRHLAEQIPDEAAEFARERDLHFAGQQSATGEVPETFMQAHLRLPGETPIRLRLALLTFGELLGDLGRFRGMLHRFDKDPAGLRIAGLGDGAEPARVAGGRFLRYQSEERHEPARVCEALTHPETRETIKTMSPSAALLCYFVVIFPIVNLPMKNRPIQSVAPTPETAPLDSRGSSEG